MNIGDRFLCLLIVCTIMALIGTFVAMRLEWQLKGLNKKILLEPKVPEEPKVEPQQEPIPEKEMPKYGIGDVVLFENGEKKLMYGVICKVIKISEQTDEVQGITFSWMIAISDYVKRSFTYGILEGSTRRLEGTKSSELIEVEESKIFMKKPQK